MNTNKFLNKSFKNPSNLKTNKKQQEKKFNNKKNNSKFHECIPPQKFVLYFLFFTSLPKKTATIFATYVTQTNKKVITITQVILFHIIKKNNII
jgi:hypothetical protein